MLDCAVEVIDPSRSAVDSDHRAARRGRTKLLGVALLAFAIGCSAASSRPAPSSSEPTGCCCSLGTCRGDLSETDCVSEAQFQGWTYKWHPGACTAADTPLPR